MTHWSSPRNAPNSSIGRASLSSAAIRCSSTISRSPYPVRCDSVFAVIDTAVKTGTDNDGTAVTYFGYDRHAFIPLVILDWDIEQIEGAVLETWLPSVFSRLEELAR